MKPKTAAQKRMRSVEDHHCPAYSPFTDIFKNPNKLKQRTSLVQGVRSRVDVDYARHLVGLSPNSADQAYWSPNGWCERPRIDPFVCAFLLFFLALY